MKLRAKFTRILTFLQAEVAREMIIKVVKLRLLINIRKQKKGKYVSIDASEMLSDLFFFFTYVSLLLFFHFYGLVIPSTKSVLLSRSKSLSPCSLPPSLVSLFLMESHRKTTFGFGENRHQMKPPIKPSI